MNKLLSTFLCLGLVALAGSSLAAHDVTYLGTVVSAVPTKVVVNVTDEKTKKTTAMSFAITTKTKIVRGEKAVAFADAHMTKEERVAVTINHEEPGQKATLIRLPARK